MRIRFVKPWRNFFVNEVTDLPEEEARTLISSGYAVAVERGEGSRAGGGVSGPVPKSVTVRVGEDSWVEISLWPPRPKAEEVWKRRAGVTVRKLGRENGAVQVREVLHLTPGTALSVGAVLLQWGVEGKVLDREVEE